MALGQIDVAEKCYQLTKSFDKLNFFYATTGCLSKLGKMGAVAQSIGDSTLRFNNATLTTNIGERVRILAESGQIPLAYMTARAHNLDEYSKTLEKTLIESDEYDHERIF